MFQKYVYFLISLLVYSTTYSMQDIQQKFLNVNHPKLSNIAKATVNALAYTLTMNPNSVKDAEIEFLAMIDDIVKSPITTISSYKRFLWDDLKSHSNLSILSTSKVLQDAFTIIQENSGEEIAEQARLMDALKQFQLDANQFLHLKVEDPRAKSRNANPRFSSKKSNFDKTNTPNGKESKIANDYDKKEDSKKPTILQSFPFGKVIAVVGILGAIVFLYHKHSNAQEHPAQVV